MNRKLSLILAAVLLSTLLLSAASAEIISFDGTVTVKDTVEVYAPIGGSVADVAFNAGETVKTGDTLVTLKTTKVYATMDGTITGIFGEPGDSCDTVTTRYGAVMYMEGTSRFTITGSTEYAYNSTDTKCVHIGEQVYLISRSDSTHTGTGEVTAVSGTSFTVEVKTGTFETSESCDIYRGTAKITSKRIGRGSTTRVAPTAVTGTGSIVSFAVQNGDTVTRGQLLFETLDGSFDGLYMSGSAITATADGVVGSVSATKGGAVQKDAVVAVIYPTGSMRIEGSVAEADLSYVHVGDTVELEMNWNPDDDQLLTGTISMISSMATTSAEGSTTYTVYIDFTPDENIRYGMTCLVSTIDTAEPAAEAEEAEEAEEAAETPAAEENAQQWGERPEGAPEGMPEGGFPQEGVTDNAGN